MVRILEELLEQGRIMCTAVQSLIAAMMPAPAPTPTSALTVAPPSMALPMRSASAHPAWQECLPLWLTNIVEHTTCCHHVRDVALPKVQPGEEASEPHLQTPKSALHYPCRPC